MTDLPPKFDHVARVYRWAEYLALGPTLQRVRLQYLSYLPRTGHALILGDGDGRFTARLLRHSPRLQVTAIDSSPAMLRLLTNRCQWASNRLNTHLHDLRDLEPLLLTLPASDLIVTHFVLDCLTKTDTAILAQTLHRHAAPGAWWLVSDFAIPTRQPMRLLGAVYIRLLYFAFRLLTGLNVQHLPPITSTLAAAGWRSRTRHTRLGGLLFSALYETSSPGFGNAHATAPTAPSSTQT